MANHLTRTILEPVITEKSTSIGAHNKFTFKVSKGATKSQIKEYFKFLFPDRKIKSIKTLKLFGHKRRTKLGFNQPKDWKKAIITVEGARIEYFPEST